MTVDADMGDASSVPYSYHGTTPISEVVRRFDDGGPLDGDGVGGPILEVGAESGVRVRVAGRVMLSRQQGKVGFATLRDWTGEIQLFSLSAVTAGFDGLRALNLGDWIGAEGEVVRTRRGELSVKVESWSLLAKAQIGFGDKWRGVNDPELRFRQREVDLWANGGVRDRFLVRSRVVKLLRDLLDQRCFVEVETPILQPLAGGANAKPFLTWFNSMHSEYALRIATELYLKRLVIGGFERVFELGRIFRNEGISPKHNPEFTTIEAYQAYADYNDVAELVEYLVVGVVTALFGSTSFEYMGRRLELAPPWRKATINEVIAETTGAELELDMGLDELRRRSLSLGIEPEPHWDEGKVIAEVYEKLSEPNLWDPVHVCDYPASVSPLTRRHRSKPGYAERITPIIAGREIAECYSELVDPDDQRQRFVAQMAQRDHGDEEAMQLDEDFLRALERGMPPTGGIGFGIDRFVMLLTDVHHIREVLLFPALRPSGAGTSADDAGSGASPDAAGAADDGASADAAGSGA
jgi:lysyl-tRNA synthetase class 2